MAAKIKRTALQPDDVKEVGRALEWALGHPTVDALGTLAFRAPAGGEQGRPISKPGRACPHPTHGLWSLPDLVKVAALLRTLA